jgi:hypothetical protein
MLPELSDLGAQVSCVGAFPRRARCVRETTSRDAERSETHECFVEQAANRHRESFGTISADADRQREPNISSPRRGEGGGRTRCASTRDRRRWWEVPLYRTVM